MIWTGARTRPETMLTSALNVPYRVGLGEAEKALAVRVRRDGGSGVRRLIASVQQGVVVTITSCTVKVDRATRAHFRRGCLKDLHPTDVWRRAISTRSN